MTTTTTAPKEKLFAKRLKQKKLFLLDVNGLTTHITVWVVDATQDVWIKGRALYIINGQPGKSFACGLANTALAKENIHKFPHSVMLASFLRSAGFIVTEEKRDGIHIAVRYEHSYGHLTDMNDERKAQELAKKDPEFFERLYHLRIPKLSEHIPGRGKHIPRVRGSSHRAFLPRGSLARAIKAGIVSKDYARTVLKSSARISKYDRKTTEQALKK